MYLSCGLPAQSSVAILTRPITHVFPMIRIARQSLVLLSTLALPLAAQGLRLTDSLRVYYVGRPVGWEHYTLGPGELGIQLNADFDYVDRGRRIHSQVVSDMGPGYEARRLELTRFADTTRTLALRILVEAGTAHITRGALASDVPVQGKFFALSQYAPVSQHLALVRFWRGQGSPDSVTVVPGSPLNRVSIRALGVDTVHAAAPIRLTRYAIDGVVWGTEYLWLDEADHVAAFSSAAGGLSTKAIRADLDSHAAEIMRFASRAAIRELGKIAARVQPDTSRTIAFIGATLVDGTTRGAIENSVVVVSNGRITAAGSAKTTRVPATATRVDAKGKTIVPGLWDMHAHLHQLEWIPTYLAAGVTTVRDMGNELPFITILRDSVNSGRIAGPRILAAGLVDGGGPNAFGEFSATTPEEGRAIVRRYHDLKFEQMKLYSLLSPAVVAAICDEAHKLGMTVTGHVPNSLSLTAAVDSGMDQVAHLPLRGDPLADSTKRVIAHLAEKHVVIDPTVSWNEIGGHSTSESVQAFQPVLQHLPAPFVQFRVANWGTNVDTATAHGRLARSLVAIKALHDAGVAIVAGTDEGVPAFSVYREIELYVKAGFTPLEALRSATSVSAASMKLEKEVGTIEAGKRADLLVLDGNPLDDISNIRKVRSVMRAGKLYDSAALWGNAGFKP